MAAPWWASPRKIWLASLSLSLVGFGLLLGLGLCFWTQVQKGKGYRRAAPPLALAVFASFPCFRRGRPMISSVLASVDCFPPTHRVYQLDLS